MAKLAMPEALDSRLPKAQVVYEILRDAIVSMRVEPGSVLTEKEICEDLGLSRTPLREAILQLTAESLVIVKPGGGTFVNRIIMREVLEGQIVRDTIEARMVQLAARNYSEMLAKDFELSLFQQQSAAARKDFDEFFSLDNKFHQLICRCSGFPKTWQTIQGATAQLDRVRRYAFPLENNFDEVVREHTAIFEAIRQRDEEGALSALQVQLDSIFGTIDLIRAKDPELIAFDGTVTAASIR